LQLFERHKFFLGEGRGGGRGAEGEMGRWGDGEMGRWGDWGEGKIGRLGKIFTLDFLA
jgi:hypothetical protein